MHRLAEQKCDRVAQLSITAINLLQPVAVLAFACLVLLFALAMLAPLIDLISGLSG